MQKTILFIAIISLLTSCVNDVDDYSHKKEQELWLNGYTQRFSHDDPKLDGIRFLFFSANKNEEFETKSYPSGVTTFYQYINLKHDKIYSQLCNTGELKLKSGKIVKPMYDFDYFPFSGIRGYIDGTLDVKLAVGRYFVVAFCSYGGDGSFMNKYATTYYTLKSRYIPQSLTVVIPAYYDRCGAIPWSEIKDSPVIY